MKHAIYQRTVRKTGERLHSKMCKSYISKLVDYIQCKQPMLRLGMILTDDDHSMLTGGINHKRDSILYT